MKNVLRYLPKKVIAVSLAVAAAIGITSAAIAGFGPDRPTKAWSPTVEGFDHVTFNSFTGVPNGIGDERDFLRGSVIGTQAAWSDPVNSVPQDATVEAKIYIHNGADARLNASGAGIAKGVTVRVAVPTTSKQAQDITSYIGASNASPAQIFDTLSLTGANGGYFEMTPVPGSAQLYTNGVATPLSDAIFTGGVNIGDQKGCFEYTREIKFRVKIKMPNYSISKQTKVLGKGEWTETVSGAATDTFAWMITFTNTGRTELKNVKIVDNVPANMTVVPGSVKLTNGNYPNGYVYPASAVQANGRQVNVDIGNYNPDAAGVAYVTFRTTLTKPELLACGNNDFVNEAYATPTGYGAIRDIATVQVPKECQTVVEKKCEGLTVTKISRTEFGFKATAKVTNAVVTSYVFTTKDSSGKVVDSKTVTTNALSADYRFSSTTPGEYMVKAVINTNKGVADGTCEQKVVVEKEPTVPVYVCKGITVEKLGDRKVRVVTSYEAEKATVKNFEYSFGDGSTALVTDKSSVDYQYAKDGTYKIAVKVTFLVNGQNQTVSGSNCEKVVTIETPITVVKPATLPDTGAGSMLGLFAISTVIGLIGYRRLLARD